MKNIEQEYKWDGAKRGAFACFVKAAKAAGTLTRARALRITDYYLDSPDGAFSHRKIALRIRRVKGKFEATLKTKTKLVNGLARRKELTLALPQARSLARALAVLSDKGSWAGCVLQDLVVRFVIVNKRTVHVLRAPNCRCEVALDHYVTCAKGKRFWRKEIELELKKGSEKAFLKVVQKINQNCSLPAATISKMAGAERWLAQKLAKTNF